MESQQLQANYSEDLAALFCKFIRQWKYPVCVIYGNPDTGKTDTAVLMAAIGLKEKALDYFASNINTYGNGQKITSLESVNYWFSHQQGNKLYVLDEAGINDDTRSPLSGVTRKIRHNVFIARKFKGHWVFILQDIKDLDTWKDSPLTGMIIKKQVFDCEFVAKIKCKWEEELITVRDFPRSFMPFDTLDIAPFTLEEEPDTTMTLQGDENKIGMLFARGETGGAIAKTMTRDTGKKWQPTQVYRILRRLMKNYYKMLSIDGDGESNVTVRSDEVPPTP